MTDLFDVVIIGAGPGGSASAHYLAQRGLKVAMVDKAVFPRDKTCGDGLTPRALWVLEDMGILDEVASFAYRINGLELHGSKGNVMTAAIPRHELYPDHLMIAPRYQLDDVIRRRALASGAGFLDGLRVRGVEQFEDYAEVIADRNGKTQRIKGRVVVMAVGANMGLLVKMGILNKTPALILAARGYYEGLQGLSDRVQAHFAEVPLPGYGWVFPTSETSANIGIGYWTSWAPWNPPPSSAKAALDHFLRHNEKLKAMMAGADLNGPVKGFPLRIDFAEASTTHGRILLVGESAGLVSPLTGEGIDFALESGQLAARFLFDKFENGHLHTGSLTAYDQLLRQHFQRLFVFLTRIRQLYINPYLMNKAILAAQKFPELKEILVRVMMGEEDAASMVNFPTVRKVILGV